MTTKKKLLRICYPSVVVMFGVYLIVVRKAAYSAIGPELDGPLVATAGVVLVLFGTWGLVGTIREIRKEVGCTPENPSDKTKA